MHFIVHARCDVILVVRFPDLFCLFLHNQAKTDSREDLPSQMYNCVLASFPGLPHFFVVVVLWFVFSTIHKRVKSGEGLGTRE